MKTLLLLMTLLTLASCGGGDAPEGTKFKSAYGNTAAENPKIETTISKIEMGYEILSNESSHVSEVKDGVEYSCKLDVFAGDTVHYKISGNRMAVHKDGQYALLERLSGKGNELNGQWQLVEGKTTLYLTFDNNKLTMELKCSF